MTKAVRQAFFKKRKRRGNKYGAVASFRCLDCGAGLMAKGSCIHCKSENTRRFDSKAEARRFDELRVLERGGAIKDLVCQKRIPLEVNGALIGHYVADFAYQDGMKGPVLEDVKGGFATDTAFSKFKRKHVAAQYGQEVEVLRR